MDTLIEAFGTAYGAGDVKLNILGRTVVGLDKIKYGTKQEKKNLYAMGREPVQRGLGQRTYECALTFKAFEMDAISKSAPNGDISQIKPFVGVVTYMDGDESLIKTDALKYIEFTGEMREIKGGDTEVVIECEVAIGGIQRNI